MIEFRLPDIGEGMGEAELLDWLVAAGERVSEGQPLAEISTDKVAVQLPAPCDGTLVSLNWQVGDTVPVGSVLLTIAVDDEAEIASAKATDGAGEPVRLTGTDEQSPARPPTGSATAGSAGPITAATGLLGRVVAAPSTRRFAKQHGVDLRTVTGSGPGGRILRADVTRSLGVDAAESAAHRHDEPSNVTAAPGRVTREPLRGIRATAAERMALSARTYATSTSTIEVHADGLLRLQRELATEAERAGVRLGVLPLIASSVAAALEQNPRFNATIDEQERSLLLHQDVDLGVAVATPNGLVVPVLRAARNLRLMQMAALLAELAERARAGRLTREDAAGGSFTLSSTGGQERARLVSTTPIINPPQVATLWVSRIAERPRVVAGNLEAGPILVCSLSFDHRYLDGADVTGFLNDLDAYLSTPERALA